MMFVILMIIGTLIMIFAVGCFMIGAWAHQNDLKFEKKDGKTVMSYRPGTDGKWKKDFGVSENSTKEKK